MCSEIMEDLEIKSTKWSNKEKPFICCQQKSVLPSGISGNVMLLPSQEKEEYGNKPVMCEKKVTISLSVRSRCVHLQLKISQGNGCFVLFAGHSLFC